MENEYFIPNPALKAASTIQDQVVGRQQAELEMAAMAAQPQPQIVQQGLEAPAQMPIQENPQGLGLI